MLVVTSDAAEAIRALLASEELPESAGVRLSPAANPANGSEPAIAAELALAPLEDDLILSEEGARLFIPPEAVPALDEKLLDAGFESDNEVRFSLRDQP